MQNVKIFDQSDNRFPFGRAMFEDPTVLYHGSWSVYSESIEQEGFVRSKLPFEVEHVKTISNAGIRLGIGSYGRDLFFSHSGGGGQNGINLSMAESFWGARVYATDGGGEVVRIMLREAEEIENYRSKEHVRLSLKARWEEGLKTSPNHDPTIQSLKLLNDSAALDQLCTEVKEAGDAIRASTAGGFPVVYAIRVEPGWFTGQWERHLYHVEESERTDELRCLRSLVTADRLVGKAEYPNGTSSEFSVPCASWEELVEMGLTNV